MNDLDIIKEIENILQSKLEKLDVLAHKSRGYTLNSNGQLIGLKLSSLKIENTQIERILPFLKELKSLTELVVVNNQISDISPLKELQSLTQLDLRHNQISDISPLKELKSLTQLDLRHNEISDISLNYSPFLGPLFLFS
jgi:Leucine-rich repeat (LRR) protein